MIDIILLIVLLTFAVLSARGFNALVVLVWRQHKQLTWLLCALGKHAWVPWLEQANGSFKTWCIREGCEHMEQHDQ